MKKKKMMMMGVFDVGSQQNILHSSKPSILSIWLTWDGMKLGI